MSTANEERWRKLLERANEIRHAAYALQSEGLHQAATEHMRELDRLVREENERAAAEAAAVAAAAPPASRPRRLSVSFTVELGAKRECVR